MGSDEPDMDNGADMDIKPDPSELESIPEDAPPADGDSKESSRKRDRSRDRDKPRRRSRSRDRKDSRRRDRGDRDDRDSDFGLTGRETGGNYFCPFLITFVIVF